MIKKFVLPIVASSLFALSFSKASADGLRYFGAINIQHTNPTSNINYGTKSTSNQFEKNFGLGLAAGAQYDINNSFYVNADVHANYANNNIKDTILDDANNSYRSDAKQNFSYGILSRFGYNVNDKSSAYLGLGFNYGKLSYQYQDFSDTSNNIGGKKNVFMPIVAAGVTTDISKSTQLYVEYQIQRAKKVQFGDYKLTYSNRSFVVGVRQFFN